MAWVFGHAELLLAPLAVYAAWSILTPDVDRERRVVAEAVWSAGLVVAIAVGMHHAHVFGRYLVPALPAWILCGVQGLRMLEEGEGLRRRPPRWVAIGIAGAAVAWQLAGLAQHAGEYAHYTRYYHDRQERAGRWLAEHTPKSAVIATHDVGAIAYYSHRRILDMWGLVDPEVIPHLGRPDYERYLGTLLPARGVTHVCRAREPRARRQPAAGVRGRRCARVPAHLRVPPRRHALRSAVRLGAERLRDRPGAGRSSRAGGAAAALAGDRRRCVGHVDSTPHLEPC